MERTFYLIVGLLLIFMFGCSSTNNLNQKIHNSQSLITSSSFMSNELKLQLSFRKKYIDHISEIAKIHSHKPIVIVESYDFICNGCPADYVIIYNEEVLIKYTLESIKNGQKIDEIKYLKKEHLIKSEKNNVSDDLKIIYKKLNSKEKWNSNPEQYDSKTCSDGAHTFYSVYYPNGNIESMYIRCWVAQFEKNEK